MRASKVTYDRKDSAFALYDFTSIDFEKTLKGYTWLHLSGITPALSPNCRKLILLALFRSAVSYFKLVGHTYLFVVGGRQP